MKRLVGAGVVLVLCAAGAGWLYAFAHRTLTLPVIPFEFTVARGASLKVLDRQLHEARLLPFTGALWWLGRATGQAPRIKAGRYRLEGPVTPLALLKKLDDGDVVPVVVTLVEGTTFAEWRAKLDATPEVKSTLKGLADGEVMARLGAAEKHPEGLFAPDTYRFADGVTDLEVLKLAYHTQRKRLAAAWEARAPNLPYANAYEALIMASIIEKETGKAEERPLIASVFVNRLRIPMRLQTDPTVIYGMGARFDGNVRKRDLTHDTPYNTYTRDGLPPTPIAMPGLAAIRAALNPAPSDRLYFVAKGDGSHHFSATLAEHNRAVAKYQLGR